MSVKDLEGVKIRQMENLKRQQAREISQLQRAGEELKTGLKDAQKAEVVDLKQEHIVQVDKEARKKEKVLAQMREHLETTKQHTSKELKNLQETSEAIKARDRARLSLDRDRVQAENNLYMDELSNRYATEVKKVREDGLNQIDKMEHEMTQEYARREGHFGKRLNDQTNNFNTRFQTDGNKYYKIKTDQDAHFKKERMATNQRQQTDMAKITEGHNQQLDVREGHFRKGLKDQDLFFEDKYNKTLKGHNENFVRLTERQEKVITDLKTKLSEKINTAMDKSRDPFYSFTELRPQLTQTPEGVKIKVDVPEHAKNDVQLTINGKEAIVNFNRRYDDSNTVGTVTNKLHKVETYTTRMKTDHVLDPKKVTAQYENGVMTWTVSKV